MYFVHQIQYFKVNVFSVQIEKINVSLRTALIIRLIEKKSGVTESLLFWQIALLAKDLLMLQNGVVNLTIGGAGTRLVSFLIFTGKWEPNLSGLLALHQGLHLYNTMNLLCSNQINCFT